MMLINYSETSDYNGTTDVYNTFRFCAVLQAVLSYQQMAYIESLKNTIL